MNETRTTFVASMSTRDMAFVAYRACRRTLQAEALATKHYVPTGEMFALLNVALPPSAVKLAAYELMEIRQFYANGGVLYGGAAVQARKAIRQWLSTVEIWAEGQSDRRAFMERKEITQILG